MRAKQKKYYFNPPVIKIIHTVTLSLSHSLSSHLLISEAHLSQAHSLNSGLWYLTLSTSVSQAHSLSFHRQHRCRSALSVWVDRCR